MPQGLIPEIKASAIQNEPLPDLSADASSKDDSEPEDGEVDSKKGAEDMEVTEATEEEEIKDTRVIHRTVVQVRREGETSLGMVDTRVMFRYKYHFFGYWDFLMVMRNSFSGKMTMKIKHSMSNMQAINPPSIMKIKS